MTRQWTFMVYMAANNDLSGNAGDNIDQLRTIGSTDSVAIGVFVKEAATTSTGTANARRMILGSDPSQDVVEDLGDIDSGSPRTVTAFVEWAVDKAPAPNYALVLWGHGSGWSPGDILQLYSQSRRGRPSITRGEANHLSSTALARSLFSTTVKRIIGAKSRKERFILTDDGSRHSLDTIELGHVLDAVSAYIGRPLDFLGMDACLMADLDVIYEIADKASVITGSEEVEPGSGWQYQTVLRYLNDHPGASAGDLGGTVVQSYVDYYASRQGSWPVTQSSLLGAKAKLVADRLNALADALSPTLGTDWPVVQKAQLKSVRFEEHLIDLGSLCAAILGQPLSSDAKDAAQAILDLLSDKSQFVLAEAHKGAAVDGCSGVSIYFPTPIDGINRYYKDLQFAKDTRWSKFMTDYVDAANA